MKKIIYIFVSSLLLVTTGCSDFFDPDTDRILQEGDYIGEKVELYSGYMGLAAGLQAVADQAIFLEGLRSELLEPTENAPAEVWDIYNYKDDLTGNSLANPIGFYNLILNANDFLQHAFKYREENPTALTTAGYNGIIGGAIRFKAWAYLMLAKIYGEAVYLEIDDIFDDEVDLSKYNKIGFDEIIDKCISLVEVGERGIDGKGIIRWSTELFPGQTESTENLEWNRICPSPDCLLAESYLFKAKNIQETGSNESNIAYYRKVWEYCHKIIKEGGETEDTYTLNASNYDGSWKNMFTGRSGTRFEHISVAFYNYNEKQTNRLIDYFSDLAPNKYYMRPSQKSIDRWEGKDGMSGLSGVSQTIKNYRGKGASYDDATTTDGYVFSKYTRGHTTPDVVYRNDVFISYYRATDIHLWLSEACAGLGLSTTDEADPNVNRHFESWVFLNGGIGLYYNGDTDAFIAPFSEYTPSLYQTSFERRGYGSSKGVRGRTQVPAVGGFLFDQTISMNPPRLPDYEPFEATFTLDSLLVEETLLESAGEARSYYAMLRMNRKYGARAQDHWAEVVGNKYPDGGASVKGKLSSDINNWFIKYDLKLDD